MQSEELHEWHLAPNGTVRPSRYVLSWHIADARSAVPLADFGARRSWWGQYHAPGTVAQGKRPVSVVKCYQGDAVRRIILPAMWHLCWDVNYVLSLGGENRRKETTWKTKL